ncbi:MAG: AAA family ATPase, partial [Candidatus Riflebacteria bacterium]
MTKKILYGTSNFEAIISDNGYYVDKTVFIEKLESLGAKYVLFLRPRRFGKSLFISTLEHYYDINRAGQFDELFGKLYIGKNPTPLKNSFPILKFNFSGVISQGTVEEIEHSFNLGILSDIRLFYARYEQFTGGETAFKDEFVSIEKASDALRLFINLMLKKQIKYYLLIDEYDNFANNILADHGKDRYHRITHGTGFLRNFFTIIKTGTDTRTVEKMFATGVSPLVMSDVTSGFNVGENISQDAMFNEMAGFTEDEVKTMVDYYISEKVIPEQDRNRVLITMKSVYDGYSFSSEADRSVYNSNSVLYLINQYTKSHKMPIDVIDTNMRTDYQKLRFLVIESQKLNGNFNLLSEVLETNEVRSELVRNFPVVDLIEREKFVSFLYYLGFLTIKGLDVDQFVFSVPNDMCQEILWDYVRKSLQDAYSLELIELNKVYAKMTRHGEWEPLFTYIFTEFYKIASNRDFIYREQGIKGFLLA